MSSRTLTPGRYPSEDRRQALAGERFAGDYWYLFRPAELNLPIRNLYNWFDSEILGRADPEEVVRILTVLQPVLVRSLFPFYLLF